MWIPDSNCSTIEIIPHEFTSGDKRSHDKHSNIGKGGGCFLQRFVVKFVLPVNRSGEGSDNENETCIRLQN